MTKQTILFFAFIAVFFTAPLTATAQNQNLPVTVKVENVTTKEKTWKGTVDGKLPITVFLKYYKTAAADNQTHSVKGWYSYDNAKKEIPLVGICNRTTCVLYAFKESDKAKQDSVLTLPFNPKKEGDQLAIFKRMTGYVEKFELAQQSNNTKNKGVVRSGTDKKDVVLDATTCAVLETTSSVVFQNGAETKRVEAAKLQVEGSELIKYVYTDKEVRLLFKFNYASSSKANGRCGASGQEIGYQLVLVDKKYALISKKEIPITSCLKGVSSEVLPSKDKEILLYTLNRNEAETKLTVDLRKVDLIEGNQ
jgi:hypothetical protein